MVRERRLVELIAFCPATNDTRGTPADLPYDLAGVPNGYIGSTARDLARFMQAHLDGEPAGVMPVTVAEISKRPVTPTGWDIPLEASHSTGWFVDEFAGETVVSHAGSLGHSLPT